MARLQKKSVKHVTFRGSPGKDIVFKVYGDKVIATKYPDMTGITWTPKQQEARARFKAASAYAKGVMKNPTKLEDFKRKLKPGARVYTALVREYLLQFK